MKLKFLLLIALLFSSTNVLYAGLLDEDLNFELDTLIFAGIDKYSNVVNLTPQSPSAMVKYQTSQWIIIKMASWFIMVSTIIWD